MTVTKNWLAPCMIAVGVALASGGARAVSSDEGPLAGDASYIDAKAKVEAGNYGEAIAILQRLLRENPHEADVLNLIGYSYRKKGRTQGALTFYLRALKEKPMHLGANEYLGELYAEVRQLDKARERLDVLRRACNAECGEYKDLARAIAIAERR